MAGSPVLRMVAVLVWFVISTIAFMSRFERLEPKLAVLLAVVIVGVGVSGVIWAVLPAVKNSGRARH